MANNATQQHTEAVRQSAGPAELAVSIEDCRNRLQSVELLVASSRRDALVLARLLLDDLIELLTRSHSTSDRSGVRDSSQVVRELPEGATRGQLLAARGALAAGPANGLSDEAIVALRTLLAGVAETTGGDVGWRALVARISPAWRRGLAAGVAVLVVAVASSAFYLNRSNAERDASFQKSFAAAEQKLRAGEHAAAVEIFRHALEVAPKHPRAADVWNDMGWSLQQLGRHREAIAGYQRAIAMKPDFTLAQNNLKALNKQLKLK